MSVRGLIAEQLFEQEAAAIESYEGCDEELSEQNERVSQTANISKPWEQIIGFSIDHQNLICKLYL